MSTDKNTSVLISSLLPEFLEDDGPKFQSFVKAYYEWMEQTGQVTDRSKNLLNYQDIDETAEEFLKYFRREILSQFPESIIANKNLVYKRIKDLYRAKGSEESFKLLFRILYDEEIDFYYPGRDILRASDGRWIQETTIRVTGPFVGNPDQLSGTITGASSNTSARVERVQNIFDNNVYSYEIFVEDIVGTFLDGETITNAQGDITATIISKVGALQNVIVIDGGLDHEKDDLIRITSASGSGGRATISITSNTSIVSLAITNVGSNFYRTDPVTLFNLTRAATDGTGAPLITAPIAYTGHYNDVRGFLSWSNKLQDSRYYQEYSYVLRSAQALNTYREIIKDVVHPAGMRLFGDVLINVEIDSTSLNITRENVVRIFDLLPPAIFIPNVVSADITQYVPVGDDGAIVPRPELEIELIESVFDIRIPDTGNGASFQVEIELMAAQTSALLEADDIITTQIIFLIEGVTVNTITATVGDIELANVADPSNIGNFYNAFSWINANGHTISPGDSVTSLDDEVVVGLHRIGLHRVLRTLSTATINTAITIYNDLPIYALEDKIQPGWPLINDVVLPRTTISTYASNTLSNIVADYDSTFPGVPDDWVVGFAAVVIASITSTTAFGSTSQLDFKFNAYTSIANTDISVFTSIMINNYKDYSINHEVTIPTVTDFSNNAEIYNQGAGTVDIRFVSNTIVAYQNEQVQLLSIVRISATGQRIWVEGYGTDFSTYSSNGASILIKDTGNTGSLVYTTVDYVADANTLFLVSNSSITVSGGDIFYLN